MRLPLIAVQTQRIESPFSRSGPMTNEEASCGKAPLVTGQLWGVS
ncbi:hypothetical protein PLANPX_5547 [Lacipirellula parvula]|uniref:Uncharacterized protein n=1 Tax=Lacipirellula parvula TaxID=2650471 RepID=A0A5K7XHR1_9BACT|nr:hypothetical protein PLANPX_5547 [Lacipirellula parvula]